VVLSADIPDIPGGPVARGFKWKAIRLALTQKDKVESSLADITWHLRTTKTSSRLGLGS
jgi:hypothetical protein